MTKILAIDTSHEICSVALNISDHITSRISDIPRQHARQLLPMIESLLSEKQLRASDLDGIALVIGPGSFTGLRIGAGVAQGLSFGTGVPVFCISSLAVMAMKAHLVHSCEFVNVCLHARDDEVYAACYRVAADEPLLLGREQVCAPADAVFEVAGFAAGDGWPALGAAQQSAESGLAGRSDAMVLSRVVSGQFRKGNGMGVSAARVLPVYLKDQMDYHA